MVLEFGLWSCDLWPLKQTIKELSLFKIVDIFLRWLFHGVSERCSFYTTRGNMLEVSIMGDREHSTWVGAGDVLKYFFSLCDGDRQAVDNNASHSTNVWQVV